MTDDWFFRAMLVPAITGLPFNIWISPEMDKSQPYLLAQNNYLTGWSEDVITIPINDSDHQLPANSGALSANDLYLLKQFIILNKQVLLDYWYETDVDLLSIITKIKKVSPSPTTED